MTRSLVALGFIALAGCPSARPTEAHETSTSGDERASERDPANGSIPNVCLDPTQLIIVAGGTASYDSGLGEEMDAGLELEVIGTADLDADGTLEHVVMVRCMPGGSGTFDGVWALHASDAGFVVAASIQGGDRADGGLDGARIEGTSVIVGRYSGSDEGVCCPTHVTDETWQLAGGAFSRTSVGETRPVSN